MKLINKKNNTEICSQLEKAKTFKSRLIGLIGTKNMNGRGLLFDRTNWIHTSFMSIAIDVIYLDKKMKIVKIDHSLKPWRLGKPVFSARQVIEVKAGLAVEKQLSVGDELYVGH